MSITFTINKPRQTLEQQWAYLVKRGKDNKLLAMKKFFVVLLATTGLYLSLYFLTASNDFVALKVVSVVMIALAWLVLAIIYLFLGLENLRSKRQLQQFLASISENQLNYSVQIDEEKVAIVSPDYVYELPWTEFDCFGLHNETLYVFNEMERTKSLYWNQTEMGGDAFSALLELLQRKSIKRAF